MKAAVAVFASGLLVLAASTARADLRPTVKAGIDTGGDTLVTATFTDGSTESIKANDGLFVGGGLAIRNATKTLETNITLNWKYTELRASNGNVSFSRFPIDALVFYTGNWFKIGGGLTYHINPKIAGSGMAGGINADYDNALGGVVEIDYRLGRMAIGARYTSISYTPHGGSSVKGDGLGVVVSAVF